MVFRGAGRGRLTGTVPAVVTTRLALGSGRIFQGLGGPRGKSQEHLEKQTGGPGKGSGAPDGDSECLSDEEAHYPRTPSNEHHAEGSPKGIPACEQAQNHPHGE